MKPYILLPLLLSGCAHYQYQDPQVNQTTYDVVQFNYSLAEVMSSSYPMFYAISMMTHRH